MPELSCAFLTYNCGRELINIPYFTSNFADSIKGHNAPEIIILSLQEVAPISYSFLGGTFLHPYFGHFEKAVQEFARHVSQGEAQDEIRYERVVTSNAGMTGIMLFAQPDVASRISGMKTAGVGVGNYDLGNKGAVGVRLWLEGNEEEDVEMTFVAAHLAPMEEACERRNQDWKAINENIVFESDLKTVTSKAPKTVSNRAPEEAEPLLATTSDDDTSSTSSALVNPTSYLVFGGDLNYRTSDTKPGPEDHESWIKNTPDPSDTKHYSHYLKNDQLTRERRAHRTLHHLQETPIDFPPTYKYSTKAQERAARKADQQQHSTETDTEADSESDFLWAQHRVPSWCDRILYLSPPFPGTQPTIHTYTSLPLQPTSDHKPVLLLFSIPLKPLPKPRDGEEGWVQAPFRIRSDWHARRIAARRLELAVGGVAYLALTWEGRALLLGTSLGALGGWAMIRSLLV